MSGGVEYLQWSVMAGKMRDMLGQRKRDPIQVIGMCWETVSLLISYTVTLLLPISSLTPAVVSKSLISFQSVSRLWRAGWSARQMVPVSPSLHALHTPSLSVSRSASTAMFLLIKLLLAAPAYSLPSNAIYTDNDYVDIDEGALVKVEFSKTLRK